MNILETSKITQTAIIELDTDELTTLTNIMFDFETNYNKDAPVINEIFHNLFSNLMIDRDITKNGTIDGFTYRRVGEERQKATDYGEHANKS